MGPAPVRLLPYERRVATRCFAAASSGRYQAFARNVESWGAESMTYSAAALPGLTVGFLVFGLGLLVLSNSGSAVAQFLINAIVGISGTAFFLGGVRAVQSLAVGVRFRRARRESPR